MSGLDAALSKHLLICAAQGFGDMAVPMSRIEADTKS